MRPVANARENAATTPASRPRTCPSASPCRRTSLWRADCRVATDCRARHSGLGRTDDGGEIRIDRGRTWQRSPLHPLIEPIDIALRRRVHAAKASTELLPRTATKRCRGQSQFRGERDRHVLLPLAHFSNQLNATKFSGITRNIQAAPHAIVLEPALSVYSPNVMAAHQGSLPLATSEEIRNFFGTTSRHPAR